MVVFLKAFQEERKSIKTVGRDKDKYESFVSEIINTDNFKDGERNEFIV